MTRRRLPRLTIRGRLTLVYGGVFLVAGIVLLLMTHALVAQRLGGQVREKHVLDSVPGTSQPLPDPSVSPQPPPTTNLVRIVRETERSALDAVLTQGGIALLVVTVAATTSGWLLAGRLLAPLHAMTETARRIATAPAADRSLHERIALDGPGDEVKELADTFDVMLERLDHAFDGQRRFVASASHELRTPLTVNRALLEVALHRRTASPEVRQLAETLLDVNARHERLIEGLLLLVQSDRELTARAYVDLADIVEHVAAQARAGPVDVRTAAEAAPTAGDAVLLERLVQNLVENGIRHNLAEGGWVEVTSGTRADGWAVLDVRNSGPVVPRYDVPGLFEPFRRLGADRLAGSSGAGLGLSIVQAITRAHDGEVTAEPRDDGGLVVTVALPPAPPRD